MKSLRKEIEFENNICNHFGATGWHYAPSDSDGSARTLVSAAVVGQINLSRPLKNPAISPKVAAVASTM